MQRLTPSLNARPIPWHCRDTQNHTGDNMKRGKRWRRLPASIIAMCLALSVTGCSSAGHSGVDDYSQSDGINNAQNGQSSMTVAQIFSDEHMKGE